MPIEPLPPPPHRRAEDDERIGVLYLAPWMDLGGSDKGTIDWFRRIDRTRFRPYLITTQPSPNRWLPQCEPYAEEVWDLPDLMDGAAFPAFILGFIASRQIQVVHIMNSRLAFDLLVDMSLLPEPPVVVVQFHAEEPDRSGYVRYVSTRYGNLVDSFSVTSRWLADAMGDYDVPRSKIQIITTGVDGAEEFNPDRIEPFDHVDRSRTSILWPGRLAEQKDPMLTLDVVAALRDRGLDFLLHIVGDGHMKADLEARAAELDIERFLRWYPPSQEMPRWYKSSDVLFMTSVFEGIPYVIFESFAMGVPVVVPTLPGNLEIVDDDSGWIIDPRDDVRGYADALEQVITDPDGARARGARARERMLAEHTLEQMARGHEELYDRLLDRRRRKAKVGNPAEHHEHAPEPADDDVLLPRDPAPDRSVAVIVPCFQHGKFLPDCLASIRAQTLQPAQVIVVDDASEDAETREVLDRMESEDWLDVVRMERNSGPSAARNRALELVTASYVLPLDADDKLLEDALEKMVAQLETCPEDVGFIYPNPKHFGNRHDYVEVPDYNLLLLLNENYCPATSLFDRRVFDAGVRYADEVVLGHEDWDLVLQLADRGVTGRPADGPTFLYRKRGFSRVDAVTHAGIGREDEVRVRHPRLYGNADRIKARWAPAVSVVVLPGPDGRTVDGALLAEGLAGQSVRDVEVVVPDGVAVPGDVAVRTTPRGADGPLADVGAQLAAARGRWVLAVEPGGEAAFADPALVEKLVRAITNQADLSGIALAPAGGRASFTLLDRDGAQASRPVGVAWTRDPERRRRRPVELGNRASVAEDIVAALDREGRLQWRAIGAAA